MKFYAKAIAAFLVSFTALLAAGSDDDNLTSGEWLGALAGGTAAGAAVYGIRNEPAPLR